MLRKLIFGTIGIVITIMAFIKVVANRFSKSSDG